MEKFVPLRPARFCGGEAITFLRLPRRLRLLAMTKNDIVTQSDCEKGAKRLTKQSPTRAVGLLHPFGVRNQTVLQCHFSSLRGAAGDAAISKT